MGYGCVAVSLALLGYGVWSLVWGGLAQTLMSSIAQIAVVRHPHPSAARAAASSANCSVSALGAHESGCVNYVALNGDYFVVGRLMGAVSLGLYSRAYGLMNLPHTYAASVMSSVMFPAFARCRESLRVCAPAICW